MTSIEGCLYVAEKSRALQNKLLRLSSFSFFFSFSFYFFGYVGSSLLCRLSFSCGERGLLFVVVHRLLIAVASLVAEHGL